VQRKKKYIAGSLIVLLCVNIISLLDSTFYKASTSYTNAKEFYESTGIYGEPYHAETAYGRVYYATKAKVASSSTNTKYHTVGFDVTLSGNGHSVSFTVQREGGSMAQVGEPVKSGNYEYNLYVITEDKLFELASKANSSNASYVLGASTINVRMNAIMTTKKGESIKGGITENGYGGFSSWGTIYRLKDNSDLKKMKEIFSGHEFESYINIKEDLANHLLQLRYNVLGLNPTGNNPTLGSGYSYNSSGILLKGNSTYIDSSRTLKQITLLNTGTIGLSKTGYYLPAGKEWVTNDYRYFASNRAYQSTTVDPKVGYQDHGLTLYANWKPHQYSIIYNANGGTGTMHSTSLYYDETKNLYNNTFTRTGYKFIGWNTRADGKGTSFSNQQNVKNLMSTSGSITLYAQWEPCVYKIDMDKQTGSGGTDAFWQKYATGFYSNAAATSKIGSITIPDKRGYDFTGYFSRVLGEGSKIINNTGVFAVANTYFKYDSTICANWKPKNFIVTFDMQGGMHGSIFATATYDSVYPMDKVNAPIRDGYHFMGYFTETNGAGEMIYNEFMAADKIYNEITDQTLYAHWIDDVFPEVTLSSKDAWTNSEIGLKATCSDLGSGLKSVKIYLIEADGTETLKAEATDLNGKKTHAISFTNISEGVIRYKAVATDMEGNTAESYNTALYDITAPTGEVITVQINGDTFYFEVDLTDINTGD